MEFNYDLDKQKAMLIAKENVIYGYSMRKKIANLCFSILTFLFFIGAVVSITPRLRALDLIVYAILFFIMIIMLFKGEDLQIKALQRQTEKLYKRKEKVKYRVIISEKQIAYIKKDNIKKSYSLDSIKHITYRSDLGGIFFSKSKLARFVFFIDLSSLEEESKEEVFKILLDNLTDKDAQQELKKSLPKNH